MPEPLKLVRVPSLKTVEDFRRHVASLDIELPCEDAIATGNSSSLAQSIEAVSINGTRIGTLKVASNGSQAIDACPHCRPP